MNNAVTVTQVNNYIKALLDESTPLKNIFVVGEISNFKYYFRSGHMYFILKDENSQLKAVMFSSYASRLKFKPEDGMRVICRGRISVYDRDGVYQLYVEDMQPDGVGALNLAYEQLKDKLSKEGLFDDIYKKLIPKYPRKIGVATSNIGAAIEDIKNITKRRYPLCDLVIVPTIVQGEQAASDIVKSIHMLDEIEDVDVIIVGRGGGSIEDLWAFNREEVARAVFACNTPVISAVGHETDFTICDFVADLRAPTPSAAAELAVPDINNLITFLNSAQYTLSTLLKTRLERENQRFDDIVNNSVLADAQGYYNSHLDDVKSFESDLISSFKHSVKTNELVLAQLAGKLDALSPLAVLSRGYSVARDEKNKIVKSSKNLNSGDKLKIRFSDGTANCTVSEVEYE
ncbi:MAG: exodeoxyribonuclease VII large subunit [Eubacterium sp.]|nr:exodeoxyribonuclease VII large subunit [Eubacterium sp.]